MGKEKHLKRIMELFKESPVVSYASIQRHTGKGEYPKQIVHNLLAKGKIRRLAKGFYTIHDNPQLSVFCFKPAYFGLQDALSAHNLWEQETIPIIITAQKARTGIRKILGTNVLIRRIEKRHLFGFDYVQQGDYYMPYSDIEKTLIDMVYFKERLDDETIRNMRARIDRKKLGRYLKSYDARTRKKVMNLLGKR